MKKSVWSVWLELLSYFSFSTGLIRNKEKENLMLSTKIKKKPLPTLPPPKIIFWHKQYNIGQNLILTFLVLSDFAWHLHIFCKIFCAGLRQISQSFKSAIKPSNNERIFHVNTKDIGTRSEICSKSIIKTQDKLMKFFQDQG